MENEALVNAPAELGDFAVAEQVLIAGLLSNGERGAFTLDILDRWSEAGSGLAIEARLAAWIQTRNLIVMT